MRERSTRVCGGRWDDTAALRAGVWHMLGRDAGELPGTIDPIALIRPLMYASAGDVGV